MNLSAIADYQPDLLAVVKIQLKNGETVEGILEIAGVGEGKYSPNGFAYCRKKGSRPVPSFFNLLRPLEFKPNYSRYYYLKNETPAGYSSPKWKIDSIGSDLILSSQTLSEVSYRLKDSIAIFTRINESLRPDLDSKYMIRVNDIERFEFINKPGPRWIALVKEARETFEQNYLNDYQAWEDMFGPDFFEPIWLHEFSEEEKINVQKSLRGY